MNLEDLDIEFKIFSINKKRNLMIAQLKYCSVSSYLFIYFHNYYFSF